MNQAITRFIAQKKLSPHSQSAYFYDLRQFVELCYETVSPQELAAYQLFLQDLKPAAQKRKLSAVNQFLYFLYEDGQLDKFYKLKLQQTVLAKRPQKTRADLSLLWQETSEKDGQLIALLIAYLGLLPSEIGEIRLQDINLDFQVLTVQKSNRKRILSLPKDLIPYLRGPFSGTYLFDKKGQTYSRQWLFNRLAAFLRLIGKREWTAQFLREQYILGQLDAGKSLEEVAKLLGLKTSMSLEKYR